MLKSMVRAMHTDDTARGQAFKSQVERPSTQGIPPVSVIPLQIGVIIGNDIAEMPRPVFWDISYPIETALRLGRRQDPATALLSSMHTTAAAAT